MKELMFQNQTIRLIEKNGKKWACAADIARALGYANPDKVTRIYDRHKIEFTSSMTSLEMVQDLDPQSGCPGQRRLTRVFSLRGSHLIAMFSRTAKAQEFRVWVLDALEDSQRYPNIDKSLMQQWFEAKAKLDAQEKFASLCGRGLNEHKAAKHPLKKAFDFIDRAIQPTLFHVAA